jgi:hypothetical protein
MLAQQSTSSCPEKPYWKSPFYVARESVEWAAEMPSHPSLGFAESLLSNNREMLLLVDRKLKLSRHSDELRQ